MVVGIVVDVVLRVVPEVVFVDFLAVAAGAASSMTRGHF